jgi:hypothetical protein
MHRTIARVSLAVIVTAACNASSSDNPPVSGTQQADIFMPGRGTSTLHYTDVDGQRVFEGDILIGDEQMVREPSSRQHAAVRLGGPNMWPRATVTYFIHPSITPAMRTFIQEGIQQFQLDTPFRFTDGGNSGQVRFVKATSVTNCSSFIGRRPIAQQDINLGEGCASTATVVHELGHLTGLFHEHTRRDRDNFVIVKHDNIANSNRPNFYIYTEPRAHDQDNRPYQGIEVGDFDWTSVMLYGSRAWAIDPNKPTMVRRSDGSEFGASGALSARDVLGLNYLYVPYAFHPWQQLGSQTFQERLAITARSPGSRNINLSAVGRGPNGNYYLSSFIKDAQTGTVLLPWTAWQELPGGGRFVGPPAVVSNGNGNLVVAGLGEDFRVWVSVFLTGTRAWTPWHPVTTRTWWNFAPALATSFNRDGMDLIVVGAGPQAYVARYSGNADTYNSTGWSDFVSLPSFSLASGVSAVYSESGTLTVVGRSASNNIIYKAWRVGDVWQGWTPVSPDDGVLTAISNEDPTLVSWGPGHLDLFVKSANTLLYVNRHEPLHGWSGWVAVEGLQNNVKHGIAGVASRSGRIDLIGRNFAGQAILSTYGP